MPDSQCRLAALTMQASFTVGDLTGGLVTSIQQLGEHAHRLPMLHTDNAPEHDLQATITIRGHSIAGSDIWLGV